MRPLRFASSLLLALAMPGAAGAGLQGGVTGRATVYEIPVLQVELCASGSSVDSSGASAPSCVDPYVIGSGLATFDIASVAAGAAIGSYSSFNNLPAGKAYTYVRVTLSRRFVIAGELPPAVDLPAGCRTDSNDTHSTITAAGIGVQDGGTGTPQVLYIPNVGVFENGHPTQAEYWSNGIQLIDDATFSVIFPLGRAITGGGAIPKITVAFDTQGALSGDGYLGTCYLNPSPPSVNLTVE
jgi:hypothetical protein